MLRQIQSKISKKEKSRIAKDGYVYVNVNKTIFRIDHNGVVWKDGIHYGKINLNK